MRHLVLFILQQNQLFILEILAPQKTYTLLRGVDDVNVHQFITMLQQPVVI